ncbi:MAG: NifB/NifX family molybdenum-iron cluster-binding protein [Bacilli bacterium]|nr:NifB/NifX family molybdenum-iron cluster-binding protein [Bacilli bacterium]MBN2877744.1 NifB/NifX family molybdenum-iron cluster-binding protein [Bacilli bacterium]
MKVAFAVDNNMITEHFGHCEYFVVYDVEENIAKGSEIIKNPPHQRGFLPKFLKDNSIDVIITGNMGKMAVNNLKTLGIECYLGVSGQLVDVLDQFLAGTLESNDEVCEQHMHHGEHHHDH